MDERPWEEESDMLLQRELDGKGQGEANERDAVLIDRMCCAVAHWPSSWPPIMSILGRDG